MIENVNLPQIKEKLIEKLKNTGWDRGLYTFLISSRFDDLLFKLLREAQDGKRFVPQIKYIFRPFEVCHLTDVRVVIMGQDPYPYANVPDGLAFSCSLKPRVEKSLEIMFKAINETVYNKENISKDGNLQRWADQGVLLLNSALTTSMGVPGTHHKIWSPVIANVLDTIIFNKPDTCFVLIGKYAKDWDDYIPGSFMKIKLTHPAASAYNDVPWEHENCFNRVNQHLISLNQEPIVW